ncbi:MAG: hypothetical protein Q6373_013470 [Candidatus Sigynarchaeota archaeon]
MEEAAATVDMLVGPNWEAHAMRNIIASRAEALKRTSLYLFCEAQDELGLAVTTRAMHDAMVAHGIPHEFVVGSDMKNALSPHVLARLSQIEPVFRTCAEYFRGTK